MLTNAEAMKSWFCHNGAMGASAAELGLLIGMVVVFVAGLIAVTLVEKGADRDGGDQPL